MTATTTSPAPITHRGRPVVGTIAGFFLGVFVALDLILFGVLPLESALVWVVILLGTIAGLVIGVLAPFARGRSDTEPAAEPTDLDGDQGDSASTTSDGA